MKRVFVLGASGYIGGMWRGPVFRCESLYDFRHFLSGSVLGSFADTGTIASLVAESDIVINVAESDDIALTEAIIVGLKQKENRHSVDTLIHTSGVSVFLDEVKDRSCPPDRKI